MHKHVRAVVATVASVTVVIAVAGCRGASSDKPKTSPEDRLATAKASFDDAEYIDFTLATDNLPDGVQGLIQADGTGTHDPAFTGEVKVSTDLTDITAPLIAVDDKVYAKLPFAGWSTLDPADYGAPDPAQLMATDGGISSLFTATVDPIEGDTERDGSTVLTDINGTLPGSVVQGVFPSAGDADFDVTYKLTDDDAIHSAEMTGPFYDGSDDVTYTISFNLDADAVDIQAP